MEFFIPLAEGKEQERRVYDSIKEHLNTELGAEFTSRKIFSLHYKHDGKRYFAEVGKDEQPYGELVIAILYEQKRDLYHVCTPNRGVARGMSILVGAHDVLSVTDFEA